MRTLTRSELTQDGAGPRDDLVEYARCGGYICGGEVVPDRSGLGCDGCLHRRSQVASTRCQLPVVEQAADRQLVHKIRCIGEVRTVSDLGREAITVDGPVELVCHP